MGALEWGLTLKIDEYILRIIMISWTVQHSQKITHSTARVCLELTNKKNAQVQVMLQSHPENTQIL